MGWKGSSVGGSDRAFEKEGVCTCAVVAADEAARKTGDKVGCTWLRCQRRSGHQRLQLALEVVFLLALVLVMRFVAQAPASGRRSFRPPRRRELDLENAVNCCQMRG